MLKTFYSFVFLSFSFGQLLSLSRGSGASLYLFELFLLSFNLIVLIYLISQRCTLYLPATLIPFLLFSLAAFVSYLLSFTNFSTEESIISLLYLVRFLIYLLFGALTFNLIREKKISYQFVITLILISGVLVQLLGFLQMILIPDFETSLVQYGWDPHKNRLSSFFLDPNFTGAYLVLCFLVSLVASAKLTPFINVRIWGLLRISPKVLSLSIRVLQAFFVIGIVLTFSRSAWLMLAVVVLVYGLAKDFRLLFAFVLISFLAYFAVPRIQTRLTGTTDPSDSAAFRYISWMNAVEIIKDHPVSGVGYNFYRYAQKEYGLLDWDTVNSNSGAGADSSFLFVLATTGLLGFVFYLYAFLRPLFQRTPRLYFEKWFYFALLGGIAVNSLFINSLFYPQIMLVFFTLMFLEENYVKSAEFRD